MPVNLAGIHEERIQNLEERTQKQEITAVQLDAKFAALSEQVKDTSVVLNVKLDGISKQLSDLSCTIKSHSEFIETHEQKSNVSKKHLRMALKIFTFVALPIAGAVLGKFGDSIFAFLTKL